MLECKNILWLTYVCHLYIEKYKKVERKVNKMSYVEQYRNKLKTAQDAVKVVNSGDWVDYGGFAGTTVDCDKALAARKEELTDVKIRSITRIFGVPEVTTVDPEGEHFTYNNWHFSGYDRKLHDKGLCYYMPILFRETPSYYRNEVTVDVAMIQVSPMDNHGYFNFGLQNSLTKAMLDKAKYVIVEVNQNMPRVLGGNDECIHISEVDCVVESENNKIPALPDAKISATDEKIAEMIVNEMVDGSCIQLGIGGMPTAVGALIAKSDLKDLGVHTEMFGDPYVDMYNAGLVTGRRKGIDKGKMVLTLAMGTQKVYDFLNDNPLIASYPVEYTNLPYNIAQNDNFVAINNCVKMDIFGQVASESSGTRQISGTGGQVDYFEGAYLSKGGKAFCCMTATFTDKQGQLVSRIKPALSPGTIITTPRTVVQYMVTEYGIVNMKGKSTWERAEGIVSLAHPDFREGLIKSAEEAGVWRRSNKRF